jgi:heat shock protein HslJ
MKAIVLWAGVICLFVAGCSSPEEKVAHGTTSPILTELKNATYVGVKQKSPVTLKDGVWEGEPYEEGASARPSVHFLRDFHLLGDLDGDGLEEAAVVLAANSGGTGGNMYLAVVGIRDGALKNIDTIFLGDRVQIRKAGILEGRLFMDILQAGPTDAMCCPGELAVKAWSLRNDKLIPMAATSAPVRLSLEAIAGSEWVLSWWDLEEKAPTEPEVTLAYVEGRLAGKSGCNNWFNGPVPGQQPGELTIGQTAGTMMMCSDEIMEVERRFPGNLEGVKKFGFMAGMLALTYEKDGLYGVMLFEGRIPEKSE